VAPTEEVKLLAEGREQILCALDEIVTGKLDQPNDCAQTKLGHLFVDENLPGCAVRKVPTVGQAEVVGPS
jgi:hypothetical protein